jgi:hypothetical protein
MTLKPTTWYPIAVVLTLVNLVSVGFAAEPWHATIHAALALGFGLWAQRLRRSAGGSEQLQARIEALETLGAERFDALQAELGTLRHEVGEAQERLDFAERVLAKAPEARRVLPDR